MFGRTSWQGRTYANKVAGQNQQQEQSRSQPVDYVENGRQTREANIFLRADRNEKKARERFLFHQRIRMEEKRSKLARGNILNFLMDGRNVSDKRGLMNRVLRTAGFGPSDISSIKLNEYRGAQAEVLLKDGVSFDVDEIDGKLKQSGLNVAVSSFDDKEEVLNIFGLPLTTDVEGMKKKILEAIEPFCERVKAIIATTHPKLEEDDFFGGSQDGNYKVKVVPAKDPVVQIPNFIVVDNDKRVCARAVYTKSLNEKKQMCLNCYSVDHFRDDFECPGPKAWEDYAREFEAAWQEASVMKSNGFAREMEDGDDSEEGRVARLISDLNKKFSDGEDKIAGLETEIGELKEALEAYRNEEEDEVLEEGNSREAVDLDMEAEDGRESPKDTVGSNEDGAGPPVPKPCDPLQDSWVEEMENDGDKGPKRVALSPAEDKRTRLKKASICDSQRIGQLGLQKGTPCEVSFEGRKITGKFLRAENTLVTLETKAGQQTFNIRGQPEMIRLAPKKSSV